MKKLIALLLALLMMFCMLTACNKSDDDDEGGSKKKDKTTATEASSGTENKNNNSNNNNNNNSNNNNNNNNTNQGVAVGTILDAPEVVFEGGVEDSLGMKFTVNGEAGNGFAIVQVSDELYVIYVYEDDEGVIFEVSDNGCAVYTQEGSNASFEKDTSMTQDEITESLENTIETLNMFVETSASLPAGVQYRKADASETLTIKRDYYRYDVLQSGEKIGTICIDKATGLLLRTVNAEGETYIDVTEIKISNAKLPQYK